MAPFALGANALALVKQSMESISMEALLLEAIQLNSAMRLAQLQSLIHSESDTLAIPTEYAKLLSSHYHSHSLCLTLAFRCVRLSLNEAFLDVHLYDQYWLLITVRAQALSFSRSLARSSQR